MLSISIIAAGDTGPAHGPKDGFPLERYTELIRPVLAKADLRFANCMRQYATRGSISQLAPHTLQAPEMARLCAFWSRSLVLGVSPPSAAGFRSGC